MKKPIIKKVNMEDPQSLEQFLQQISDNTQSVTDLTSRLDERVKSIVENQKEKLAELSEIRNKISTLEVKVENISLRMGNHDNRWSQIFDAMWKTLLMVLAGYILYVLGIEAPP